MAKSVKAQLIEYEQREIKIGNKQSNIYFNGLNNLYPYEVEAVINASPTASKCAALKAKFLGGKDLLFNDSNSDYSTLKLLNNKGHNVFDIVEMAGRSLAVQRGVFIWIGYGLKDGKIKQTKWEVLDFADVRISKEDDQENEGKIYYGAFDERKEVKDWFYPYNPIEDVVLAQIKNDVKLSNERKKIKNIEEIDLAYAIENYRGQVAYLNLDKHLIYPLATINSALYDADTEYRVSQYFNLQAREGFLGKTILLTQGLDEEAIIKLKKDVSQWLGVEGTRGVYHMHVSESDDLKNVVEVKPIPSTFDDKLFEAAEKRCINNIASSYNIPIQLVSASDGALFGTSGDAYIQVKKILDDTIQPEQKALSNFLKRIGLDVDIIQITAE